jgi:transcriptional regulator of acetoin/glycerol metabolism
VILAREETITLADLPEALTAGRQALPDFRAARDKARSDRSGPEKELLIQALDRFDWNITRTAEHLKLSRRHLYRLLNRHAIVRGK